MQSLKTIVIHYRMGESISNVSSFLQFDLYSFSILKQGKSLKETFLSSVRSSNEVGFVTVF